MPDTATATIDASEDAVRDAALAADRGETPEAATVADTSTETDSSPSPETDGKPTETGGDDKPTSETDTPEKPETTPGKPAANKPPAKPESAYTKAQKEKQRQENSWKKLEEEKRAHREQVAKWEAQRAEDERRRAASQHPQPVAKPEPQGPSAEAYEALAKRYEAEGDTAMAQAAREKAAEVRESAQKQQTQEQPGRQAADHTQDPQFKANWNQNVAELVKANPHLNDPADPIGKATMGLVNDQRYARFFRAHPDGIKMAHEVALLMRDATKGKQFDAVQKQLTEAKAEVDRLTKLTSLRGAPPPSGAGGKTSLSDLSGEAAEDFVRQQAMKADRGEST